MAIAKNRIPWTQRWKEEGFKEEYEASFKEGFKEGIIESLVLLLKSRFKSVPSWVIEKAEQASVEELKEWLVNFQKATTLEDVFK